MAITKTAKNKIKDLIAADIFSAISGLSPQPINVTDTSLIIPDSSTENPVTTTLFNQTINTLYVLYSNQGNGVTYKESGIKTSNGVQLNRIIFPDIDKDSSSEYHITYVNRVD